MGGEAPIIDALWPGLVDLRRHPERIAEVAEAAAFEPLAVLLQRLNGPGSPLWTAKCDLWEPEPGEVSGPVAARVGGTHTVLASYIDLLPRRGQAFAEWREAARFCQEWVARLTPVPLASCRAELIVRQAIAGEADGFGVTAYISAEGTDRQAAAHALGAALAAFVFAIPPAVAPEEPIQSYNETVGE